MSREDVPTDDEMTVDIGGSAVQGARTLDLLVPERERWPACLLEIYGEHVGRRIDLTEGVYGAGRADDARVRIPSLSVSRCHAEFSERPEGWSVRDLDSTNGTFVDDHRVGSAVLEHGNIVRLGGTLFRFLQAEQLDRLVTTELTDLTRLDGLTRTRHRAAFSEALESWFEGERTFALVVIAIDRFADLEARLHDQAAENAVSLVANLLRTRLRRVDILGRLDRATFGVLLADVAEPRARAVAEKLSRQVTLSSFEIGESIVPIRAVAVATGRRPDDAPDRMLDRALDEARRRAGA